VTSTILKGKKIAILATDGFEQVELTEPRKALDQAGADTIIIAPKSGEIKGWDMKDWGDTVTVNETLDEVMPEQFDALMLPGGVMNPDHLRTNSKAVDFVREFAQSGKPIAAICHGPWMLVEADIIRGKTITSWPSIKTDIRNAGGNWVDKDVVTDGQFITSRKPDDIPAFNRTIIEHFSKEAGRRAA
jgi:protease I